MHRLYCYVCAIIAALAFLAFMPKIAFAEDAEPLTLPAATGSASAPTERIAMRPGVRADWMWSRYASTTKEFRAANPWPKYKEDTCARSAGENTNAVARANLTICDDEHLSLLPAGTVLMVAIDPALALPATVNESAAAIATAQKELAEAKKTLAEVSASLRETEGRLNTLVSVGVIVGLILLAIIAYLLNRKWALEAEKDILLGDLKGVGKDLRMKTDALVASQAREEALKKELDELHVVPGIPWLFLPPGETPGSGKFPWNLGQTAPGDPLPVDIDVGEATPRDACCGGDCHPEKKT